MRQLGGQRTRSAFGSGCRMLFLVLYFVYGLFVSPSSEACRNIDKHNNLRYLVKSMNSLSVLEINYAEVSFVMVCHVWPQTFLIGAERTTMSCHFHLYFFSFFDNNSSQHAPKTIWITKLPHPLVQAAAFITFHQIAVYGKTRSMLHPGQIINKGSLTSGTGIIYVLIKEMFCMCELDVSVHRIVA